MTINDLFDEINPEESKFTIKEKDTLLVYLKKCEPKKWDFIMKSGSTDHSMVSGCSQNENGAVSPKKKLDSSVAGDTPHSSMNQSRASTGRNTPIKERSPNSTCNLPPFDCLIFLEVGILSSKNPKLNESTHESSNVLRESNKVTSQSKKEEKPQVTKNKSVLNKNQPRTVSPTAKPQKKENLYSTRQRTPNKVPVSLTSRKSPSNSRNPRTPSQSRTGNNRVLSSSKSSSKKPIQLQTQPKKAFLKKSSPNESIKGNLKKRPGSLHNKSMEARKGRDLANLLSDEGGRTKTHSRARSATNPSPKQEKETVGSYIGLQKILKKTRNNPFLSREITMLWEAMKREKEKDQRKILDIAKELAYSKVTLKKVSESPRIKPSFMKKQDQVSDSEKKPANLQPIESLDEDECDKEICKYQKRVRDAYIRKNLNGLSFHTQNSTDSALLPFTSDVEDIVRKLELNKKLFFPEKSKKIHHLRY